MYYSKMSQNKLLISSQLEERKNNNRKCIRLPLENTLEHNELVKYIKNLMRIVVPKEFKEKVFIQINCK